jgi:dihydrofolate reductase
MAGDQSASSGVTAARLPLLVVAAVARNGVIGANNVLLWRLPSDLKRFRALTMGKPLVMGRKTFDAIGLPLQGRETIIVTRDKNFAPAGALVGHSIEAALALATARATAIGADAIVIAGGGEIYAQTIGRADRLSITEVALDPFGDTRFPRIDPSAWREVRREAGERGPRDEAGFAFIDYERRGDRL